jgi:protein O-GlcNAc transferase
LAAVGLPELIVPNLEAYEALAVKLAKNPVELNSIKLELEKNRLTVPMFDTPRYANNLEKAYRQMWQIFLSGENARPINVLDSEGF